MKIKDGNTESETSRPNTLRFSAEFNRNEENAMAKAIQEKARSTFRSFLRKNISRCNNPREKQMLPTNINAKENRLIIAMLPRLKFILND